MTTDNSYSNSSTIKNLSVIKIEPPKCLKCSNQYFSMYKVGAFTMCEKCLSEEFGSEVLSKVLILPDINYGRWLKIWKELTD